MFPDGWLMNPKGNILLFFEKDPLNPVNEGYIEFWVITGVSSKQFRYRKRTNYLKAVDQWTHLLNKGWKVLEETEQVA
tara:strand:+ start:449 stop:682 length:234 start_codon:yes stop_codon:yes gene_type:complete